MRRVLLLFLASQFLIQQGLAQKYLVLEKLGAHKRYEYHIGDQISFKLKYEEFFRTSVLVDMVDSVVIFDYGFFSIKDIESVNIRGNKGPGITRYALPLIAAGGLLFLIDQFNETVIHGNKANLSKGVTIASGSLVVVGLLMVLPGKGIKKLKRNWRLRLVDI